MLTNVVLFDHDVPEVVLYLSADGSSYTRKRKFGCCQYEDSVLVVSNLFTCKVLILGKFKMNVVYINESYLRIIWCLNLFLYF